MLWPAIVGVLIIIVVVLLMKIATLHKAADEIRQGMSERMEQDTNTLISVSTRDRTMCKLADCVNKELQLLRNERKRFQNGDRELKEAIANISHDLRTPLTAIGGYLSLMEKEEKSKDATRYLSFIKNRTLAMKQLTEELFNYSVIISTPENLPLADVNLNSVLEESVATYYATLNERGIIPTIKIPERKIIRQLNHDALSRIFSNILNNALKYSDGDLEIVLSETGEIMFSNTAPALTEVQVGRLFDRFYTVETARNSTGLGLTISKLLVEQMQGEISAEYCNERLSICVRFSNSASS